MAATIKELEEALNKKFLFVKRNTFEKGYHSFSIEFPNWRFYLCVIFEGSRILKYPIVDHYDRDWGGEPEQSSKYNGTIEHLFEIIENEFLKDLRNRNIFKRKTERLRYYFSPLGPIDGFPENEMEIHLDGYGHLEGQRTWR